ncbi:Trp biosynthesis-associated membrane protein, partial [Streptomonospora sp. S1-112]
RARAEYGAALAALALGAGALLGAGGRVWAQAEIAVGGRVAPAPVELTGQDAAAPAFALGLAGLAALAAVVAARGWARRAVGGAVAAFGAAALYSVWQGTRTPALTALAAERSTAQGRVEALHVATQWPALAALGAALLVAAGAAVLLRGAAWPGMSSRYDRHSAPSAARSSDPAELWKSLDSGADPTLDPPEAAAPPAPVRQPAPAGRADAHTEPKNPKEP